MKSKNQNGYSLLEIPISLFIIGLVLVIYSAASNAAVLNANARHQELAERIAVSEMEDLRAAPYNLLPGSGPVVHPLLSLLPGGTANLTVDTFNAATKRIDVTVTWKEPGNSSARTVSFTTLITKNGL